MTSIEDPVVGGAHTDQQKAAKNNLIGLLDKTEAVKGIMAENFEKVLDRGEKLEHLHKTSETLVHEAQVFADEAKKPKSKKKK